MVQQKFNSSSKSKKSEVECDEIILPELRFSEFEKEWIPYRLQDIGYFKNGVNKSSEDFGEGYPFVNLDDVFNKNYLVNQKYGLVNVSKKELKEYNLLKGDVLFVRSSVKPLGVGLTTVILEDLNNTVFSGFLIRFRTNDSILDTNFKKYCFNVQSFRRSLLSKSTTSANTNINQESLNRLFINIPSLAEQKKIAKFLTSIDKKIDLLEKTLIEIEKFNVELVNKIMTQNFEVPNQTNVWEEIELRDIGSSYTGLSGKNKDDFNKGNSKFIPYLSVFNDIILDDSNFENVDIKPDEKQNLVKKGDIFFTGSSETPKEVGMASVLLEDLENCYLNSFCFGFRLKSFEEHNPLFLVYYFRSLKFKKELFKLAQGSTRFNISKKELLKQEIELPSKIEQDYYVNIIKNMFAKTNYIKKELGNIEEFKKGLFQKMFV